MFKRLCIIGLGLIGGSIAKAAREQNLCKQIVALGQASNLPHLQLAKSLGVIDAYYTEAEAALELADLVIIATPVGVVENVLKCIQPYWNEHTLYSDACSTKVSVVSAVQAVFGRVPTNFIPAHPIAGAERSGVEAATAALFRHRRLIITPLDNSDEQAVKRLSEFWQGLGATVSVMGVEHHDTVLAATSHLPHLLAFSLVGLLGRKDEQREIFKYAAGGFKDFSRIASSDPTMWRDIALANKHELIPLIQQFQAELSKIEQFLVNDQHQQLFETFTYANQARLRFLDQQED